MEAASKKWWVVVEKEAAGPYDSQEIESLLATGTVKRNSIAAETFAKGAKPEWKYLWQFKEFDRRGPRLAALAWVVFLLSAFILPSAQASLLKKTVAHHEPASLYRGNRQGSRAVGQGSEKKSEVDRSPSSVREKDVERKEPREASDYERRLGGQGPEEDPKPNR